MDFGRLTIRDTMHRAAAVLHARPDDDHLGKSKKVHFQQYYSYVLLIIYAVSEENKQ